MPDTARTLAALQALLPDNTTHLISPQDLRDFMQSVATPVVGGGFHAVPGVNVQDAPFNAAGDGAADDGAPITAAVAAAGVGGTVYFPTPSVKYKTTTTVSPLAGQRWVGTARQAIDATAAHPWISYAGAGVAVDIGSARGVRLSGLRIECTNNVGTVVGLRMIDPSLWNIIEGCTIKGPAKGTGTGIKLTGQSGANAFHAFRDVSVAYWNDGVRLSGYANSNEFSNPTFNSCTTAISFQPVAPDAGGGSTNLFSRVEVNGDCTNGIDLSFGNNNTFVKMTTDAVPGSYLTLGAGVIDNVFITSTWSGGGTFTDNSGAYETLFLWCRADTAIPGSMSIHAGGIEMAETFDADHVPAANRGNFYVRDNGFGKTQLCARFPTGAVQVIATEP